MPDLVPLPGSERTEIAGAQAAGPLDDSTTITVTLILRRRAEVPDYLVTGPETVTSAELGERYGANPDDIATITSVLGGLGLTVTESMPESRRLRVSGTIAAMSAAFGTTLTLVTSPHPDGTGNVTHRYRSGGLSVPAELAGVVTAVLGLDDRPQARPQFRRLTAAAAARTAAPETAAPETAAPETAAPETAAPETAAPETAAPETAAPETAAPETAAPETAAPETAAPTAQPLTALQVASFYQFPPNTDGTGQTIAIIELGGGYNQSDLDTYFSGLGLATPSVTAVGVDGGSNSPGQSADGEVELDIEVAGAVAPKAAQYVYFAGNTDAGFIDAVSQAIHATPTPAVVSISWGQSEDQWSEQSRNSMDAAFADGAALGVTVTVAAGDNGSSDTPGNTTGMPVHCDFPASSPHALACGGTKLIGDTSTYTITSEVVWNELANQEGAGGGGVSDVFPLPSWQTSAGVPTIAGGTTTGRGVPDVAGNADPVTGYQVVVDGQPQTIGGTSAVAPLWAGLLARLTQATGKKFGLLQPLIYAGVTAGTAAPGFNDIVSGNNGAYSAGPGWDACTGLGSPDGTALLARLGDPPAQAAEEHHKHHWWQRNR
jgi:kumamolisin